MLTVTRMAGTLEMYQAVVVTRPAEPPGVITTWRFAGCPLIAAALATRSALRELRRWKREGHPQAA